jgi:hypothetical protein
MRIVAGYAMSTGIISFGLLLFCAHTAAKYKSVILDISNIIFKMILAACVVIFGGIAGFAVLNTVFFFIAKLIAKGQ